MGETQDRVLPLGSSAVGTARRLSTSYDNRGVVATLTTWDDPRVGFGLALNQVQNVYNYFGQQTHSYQEHGGTVNTSTTPKVEYSYANGSANTIRLTGVVYPDGRSLAQSYGTANGMNDASSRVESMKFSTEGFNLVDYQYLGSSGFVNASSAQPGISWTLIGSGNDPNTGDIYWGLDRFGRVDNCLWKTSSATLAQIEYGYYRASNRTWRKDGVLSGYDELYSYDGLYRLTDQQRGTLNGTHTAITSGTFQQQWGLDATGNWKTFKQDNDGNGTWELNQTRTANKVNEITSITNSAGAAWATPSYDEAGNMVGIPNPPATTTGSTPAWNPFTESQWNSFTEAQWNAFTLDSGTVPTKLSARYDAWNRLVEIQNGTTRLVENVYDARGYRIRKDTYVTGTLSESRHYYYTPGWQCVEERVDTSTTAERQFVWGLRYIDDLVLRDRSTANNGAMNERLYGMQDGNWNMIAVCDTTGSVTERYAYSAYGAPVFMTGAGTVQTGSASDFETLYAGYRWDGESPQMYYVRNRFLLPMTGTWNKQDPLGYVDGMGLFSIPDPINATDPTGLGEWIQGVLEDCFYYTGTGGAVLCATGGASYCRVDCVAECIPDQEAMVYDFLLAMATSNAAIGIAGLSGTQGYTAKERLRQMLPYFKKVTASPGQNSGSTNVRTLWRGLPGAWKQALGGQNGFVSKYLVKWGGRANVAMLLLQGAIAARAEAYCLTLCASMPSGWRYERIE